MTIRQPSLIALLVTVLLWASMLMLPFFERSKGCRCNLCRCAARSGKCTC